MIKQLYNTSFFLLLLISSCKESGESKSGQPDSLMLEADKGPKKFFAGKPDIPTHQYQITSAGIGSIKLGDSLYRLIGLFTDKTVDYDSITIVEDGKEWPAIKVMEDGKYVIGESANTVDIISVLRTNNPLFHTKNGIRANLPLDSLITFKDSITCDRIHKILMYGNSGVWFKIDRKTEKNYFSKECQLEQLRGGLIEELLIICGDC